MRASRRPGHSVWARRAIEHVGRTASGGPLDRTLRVTLNFHPDRVRDGETVLESLARDGAYRSQHETGTSNGGLTAYRAARGGAGSSASSVTPTVTRPRRSGPGTAR